MSSKDDIENESDKTLMSSNEDDDDDDDETIDQSKKTKKMKYKNDILDEIIDKSKLFEEQIKLLKKREDLKVYWPYKDYDDKELKSKYFKIQLADMSMRLAKSYLNKYLVIHL